MRADNVDYQSAVEQAKEFITNARFKNGFDLATSSGFKCYLADKAGSLAAYPSYSGFSGNLLSGELGEFDDQKAQDHWNKNVESLLSGAERDELAFLALVSGVANVIEKGAELHPKLQKWVAQHLRGEITPPPKAKGRGSTEGMQSIIARAVADLVESGALKATRAESSPPLSACDAVADALAQLGINSINWRRVKRIWEGWDKSMWIR